MGSPAHLYFFRIAEAVRRGCRAIGGRRIKYGGRSEAGRASNCIPEITLILLYGVGFLLTAKNSSTQQARWFR